MALAKNNDVCEMPFVEIEFSICAIYIPLPPSHSAAVPVATIVVVV